MNKQNLSFKPDISGLGWLAICPVAYVVSKLNSVTQQDIITQIFPANSSQWNWALYVFKLLQPPGFWKTFSDWLLWHTLAAPQSSGSSLQSPDDELHNSFISEASTLNTILLLSEWWQFCCLNGYNLFITMIILVWACTENGRKQNSQKSIIYAFGNKKIDR
jgi:hypothetical protein